MFWHLSEVIGEGVAPSPISLAGQAVLLLDKIIGQRIFYVPSAAGETGKLHGQATKAQTARAHAPGR